MGFCTIGEVTFESAAYVARYILKKFNNKNQELVDQHYKGKKPEYITMSRRPGIGKDFYNKFKTDIYPDDFVLTNKLKKMKPPRYYDNLFELEDPKTLKKLKAQRTAKYLEQNLTEDQIRAKEEILDRKIKKLIREIEV